MRDPYGKVDVTLLVEVGSTLSVAPEYAHQGTTYVEGQKGQRYALRVQNLTGGRVEVVPTVDGLDVRSGKDAAFDLRGHVVGPYASFDFTGFRLSDTEVATFRFGTIEQSYAAQIGKPRNVGVIGVAMFEELQPPPPPPSPPTTHGVPRSDSPLPFGAPPPGFDAASLPGSPPPPQAYAPPPAPALGGAPLPPGAPPPAARAAKAPAPQPQGLGTTFGERRESRVSSTTFERATPKPAAVLVIRYETREGLRALGIDVDGLMQRETANPFPAETGYAKPPPGWRG